MPSIGSVFATFGAKDNLTPQLKKMQGSLGNFDKRMKNSSAGFTKFGASATKAGKKMTMGLTAPIVGLGIASFKMASDFEASMTKIQSLVGKSEAEVKSLTTSVMGLAGTTARAPQELAEAMFFITSAGIGAADAAGVLEASAKAAAVGLGDTATIADLATSAMNAYGKENLSASNATDVMVSAVREGKLEASELAGSMGRVLPIASAMGVSFNEVGAAFASLSRTGTNAAEAATQVRGIMASLLRPTKQAEEALTGMGLSSEGLREQLKEKGLLSTLKTLADEFDGNAAASASVFGNVRALSGVMDLMGKNVAGTEAIFASMNNTLGATDAAFKVTSETTAFKMSQAISDFKVAMITLGQQVIPIVLPMVQKLAEFIGAAAEKFASLSGPTQKIIIGLGIVAAAAGPVIVAVGMLVAAFGAMTGGMIAALGPIGLAIAAIGLITFAILKFRDRNKEAEERQSALNDQLIAAGDPLQNVAERAQLAADEYLRLSEAAADVAGGTEKVMEESVLLAELLENKVAGAFEKVGVKAETVNDAVSTGSDRFQELANQGKLANRSNDDFADSLMKVGGKVGKVTMAIGHKLKVNEIDLDQAVKILRSLDETADAYDDNREAIDKQNKELLENTDTMLVYAKALGGKVVEAAQSAAKESGDYTGEVAKLEQQLTDLNNPMTGVQDGLIAIAEGANLATDAFVEVEQESKKVGATWQELIEVADRKALFFTLALDTTGLYEQLDDAMSAIIDLGSMMPGGDSAMLDQQLAISRRISMELVGTKEADASAGAAATKAANAAAKAAAKAAQAAHDAAVREAEKIFNSFVSSAIGIGSMAIGDSFVKAMLGEPDDIKKAFKDLFDSAFKSGLTQIPELRSTFMKALEGQELLIEIAEKRANLSAVLENAEDRLTKALENQASAQSKVNKLAADRASLASKTASAFGFEFGEDIGAKAQADRLLEQYTAFEGNLKALQTKGFPADIISQVIGLGAFAGNEAATGLLAMGETDFASFTTALAGISSIGAKIGDIQAGITFGGAQGAAASGLLGANASAEGALAARDSAKLGLAAIGQEAGLMAHQVAEELAFGIKDVLQDLPGMTDESAAAMESFIKEITAFIESAPGQNPGVGIFDVKHLDALGSLPELLKSKEFTAAVMPKGTPNDPIAVSDSKVLDAVKASLTPTQKSAQAIIERKAGVAAAHAAVLDMVGGAGNAFGLGDTSSIADDLFKKAMNMQTEATSLAVATATDFASLDALDTGNYSSAMRTRGAGFAFADAGSMGMLGNGRSGVNPSAAMDGLTINVAGSILSENDLIEVIRQGALRNQQSGTEWAPSASGVY